MNLRCSLFVAICLTFSSLGMLFPAAGSAQPFDVSVKGVEKRSNCDQPEWWVQATNESSQHLRVRVYARAKASVGPVPLCIAEKDRTEDLAPDECFAATAPFYNSPEQPCDAPCCINNTEPCDMCTTILEITVEVLAKSADGSSWKTLEAPSVVCQYTSGGGAPFGLEIVNACRDGDYSDFPCD